MGTTPEFQQQIEDLLKPIHPILTKRMFGGVGIWSEDAGSMFALISSEDVLYFKADDQNRPDYEAIEAAQFHRMPYFQVPESAMADSAELKVWLDKSVDVAKRSPKKKKKRKKKGS